jgi:hypothetical protein
VTNHNHDFYVRQLIKSNHSIHNVPWSGVSVLALWLGSGSAARAESPARARAPRWVLAGSSVVGACVVSRRVTRARPPCAAAARARRRRLARVKQIPLSVSAYIRGWWFLSDHKIRRHEKGQIAAPPTRRRPPYHDRTRVESTVVKKWR